MQHCEGKNKSAKVRFNIRFIRDDENSLGLIELSNINKVSLI